MTASIRICLAVACALAAGNASALYKVIDAQGNVTYTDRPPASASAPVHSLPSAAAPTPTWPAELRNAAAKYPVTLYATKDCAPCDAGRDFLRKRGVPYAEKSISSAADTQALKQLSGDLGLPVLTVGSKLVKAYNATEWQAHLDAAGYPAQSQLPAGYSPPPPQPLTSGATAGAQAASVPATAPASRPRFPLPRATPPVEEASGIRF